eukprot:3381911-Pleurochrysis_carterae.AAC.1
MGLPNVPSVHRRELEQANEIVRRTANLLRAAHDAGAEYILEHPADRGALASPFFLDRRHAPPWVMPDVVALKSDTSASLITFPQCALGAAAQKYTSLFVSTGLAASLQNLANLRCQHTTHTDQAGGSKTAEGWASRQHSAYPPDLNFLFARVIAKRLRSDVPVHQKHIAKFRNHIATYGYISRAAHTFRRQSASNRNGGSTRAHG